MDAAEEACKLCIVTINLCMFIRCDIKKKKSCQHWQKMKTYYNFLSSRELIDVSSHIKT